MFRKVITVHSIVHGPAFQKTVPNETKKALFVER